MGDTISDAGYGNPLARLIYRCHIQVSSNTFHREDVSSNSPSSVLVMQASKLSCICGKGQLIADLEAGEIACNACGLVSSERIEERRPEWRTFGSEGEDRSRVGSPTSLAYHDMGLATVIGRTNRDSSGQRLDASTNARIQKLRTWDFRIKKYAHAQKNLILAFSELSKLKDKLGLSDAIIEKTAYVYRKAQEKQLVRGRSTLSILAAAIYASCREMGASRTLRDITEATGVKRKDISRGYRLIVLDLDIKVPLVDPIKCVAMLANKVKVSEKTKRTAIGAMKELMRKEISAGKHPMGLAATTLYVSCLRTGEHRSQKEIADAAGVTEVTIRNRARDMKARSAL